MLEPHIDLLWVLAIFHRAAQIQQHHIRWQQVFTYSTLLVIFACVIALGHLVLVPALVAVAPSLSPTATALLLLMPYSAADALVLLFLLMQKMRMRLVQYLPGPSAEPAATLLKHVSFTS